MSARGPAAAGAASVPEALAGFAAGLQAGELPEPVADRLKLHLLDAVGCALAAVALGEQRPALSLDPRGPLGLGALFHALDFDDTHPGSICHVSAVAGPAALCATAAVGGTGADALAAYAVGVEVTARVGAAAGGDLHRRGLHPTSACGVVGAAAAAGRARGMGAAGIADAIGLSASRAGGVLAALAEGVPVKPLHAGWAARDGIECAELAHAGAAGPRGGLDGHQGLFEALLGERRRIRVEDLGETWESVRIAIKPYPVCHFIHGCLAAAQAIHHRLDDGESVVGGFAACDDAGAGLVLEPREEKLAPATTYGARFSLAWCVAHMLRHGTLTAGDLTGASLADPATAALAREVTTQTLPRERDRDAFAGAVTASTSAGRSLAERCDAPPGGPDRPLEPAAIVAKYQANAALALDADRAADLADRILGLDAEPGVERILAALGAAVAGSA